jgi:hypothetical protein
MPEEEHPLEMLKRKIAEGKVAVTEVDLRDEELVEEVTELRNKNALLKLGLYRVIQNRPGHPTVLRNIAREVLLNAGYELPEGEEFE